MTASVWISEPLGGGVSPGLAPRAAHSRAWGRGAGRGLRQLPTPLSCSPAGFGCPLLSSSARLWGLQQAGLVGSLRAPAGESVPAASVLASGPSAAPGSLVSGSVADPVLLSSERKR